MHPKVSSTTNIAQDTFNKLVMGQGWSMHELTYKVNTIRDVRSYECEILKTTNNAPIMSRIRVQFITIWQMLTFGWHGCGDWFARTH